MPRENRLGSLTIKLRYWSKTWLMLVAVPASAVCVAKSSSSGREIEDRKLIYAGEYSPLCKSCVMRCRLSAVGSTRYSTGTSGIGCRWPLMFLTPYCQQTLLKVQCPGPWSQLQTYKCMVTPQLRRSLTRSTLLITSLPSASNTSTFHIGSPSAFRIGVDFGTSPLEAVLSSVESEVSVAWLRFKMRSIEAA